MKSKSELARGAELIIMQRAGQISGLRFQPRYDLIVNGEKVCAYVGDFEYRQGGSVVVEDVKPKQFIDGEAEIKIALFNALHRPLGMTVTLHKR
jgi:hypothetical protein